MKTHDALTAARKRLSNGDLAGFPAIQPERRRHRRVDMHNLPAVLIMGEEEHPISIKNLSLSGACVLNPVPGVLEGDAIVLGICLDQYGMLLAECEVVRVVNEDKCITLGVRFIALNADEINQLIFFLGSAIKQSSTHDEHSWIDN